MYRPTWQLYGTLGCHLCEQAELLLQQFGDTRAVSWVLIDIAELPEPEMQALAHQIPVLQAAQQRLHWPFSLMDMMQIYQRGVPSSPESDR